MILKYVILESSWFKIKETQIVLATYLIRVFYCIVKTKLQVYKSKSCYCLANYVFI